MSKHINVNPNFYKVGGREHAEGHGEAIAHDREKQALHAEHGGRRKTEELPGHKQVKKGSR